MLMLTPRAAQRPLEPLWDNYLMSVRDSEKRSAEERAASRRARIVVNRARSFAEAEQWDLDFWQTRTPEERLSAFVALRRDVELALAARKAAEESA